MTYSVKSTIIIGAGLTGLSTAHHLKDNYTLFEKAFAPGGVASSENVKGFIFDKAGHLLHFKTGYAKKLIETLLNGNRLSRHKRLSWVFSKNTYTRYPFQVNTYGLPTPVIKDCLLEMAQAQTTIKENKPEPNFKDWILENFGEGIARHFMFPYNRKLWRTPLSSIGTDWVDRFIPKTQLGCAIKGAVSDFKKGFGYNKIFYYPNFGGIQAVSDSFLSKSRDSVLFQKEVTGIDLKDKTLTFLDGQQVGFHRIVSTMPLPELVKMIKNVPLHIKTKARSLKYVSVFNLNIGVDRDNISDKHWIYFPERKYIFHRVGFFSNFSDRVCPKGKNSLYTEVSYTADNPLKYERNKIKERIILDLNRAGILKANDRIAAEKSYYIKHAYPVCGKNGFAKTIDKFLKTHNIYSIGRYGSWRYMSMEECIIEGKLTADYINSL